MSTEEVCDECGQSGPAVFRQDVVCVACKECNRPIPFQGSGYDVTDPITFLPIAATLLFVLILIFMY